LHTFDSAYATQCCSAAPKRKAEDEEDSKANVKGKGGAAAKKAKSGAAAKGGKGSKASGSK